MDGWKKVGNVLHGAITALFGILMLCILFATVAIDRNIDNPFANTVRFDNAAMDRKIEAFFEKNPEKRSLRQSARCLSLNDM